MKLLYLYLFVLFQFPTGVEISTKTLCNTLMCLFDSLVQIGTCFCVHVNVHVSSHVVVHVNYAMRSLRRLIFLFKQLIKYLPSFSGVLGH